MGAALLVFSKGARTGTDGITGLDFVSASSRASRFRWQAGAAACIVRAPFLKTAKDAAPSSSVSQARKSGSSEGSATRPEQPESGAKRRARPGKRVHSQGTNREDV